MYPLPKRRWPGLVAAYVLLIVVLALPGVPLYYYLDPTHKPLVIRVCTGVLLAFTLHRLVVRPGSFDRLRHPRTLTPTLSRREREKSTTHQTKMDRLLVRSVRERLERQPASDFAVATRPRQEATHLAPHFARWQHEVTHSLHSRSYFVHVLRPRLLALWEHKLRARGGSGLTDLTAQSADEVEPGPLSVLWHEPRRLRPRRGISLRTLRALVQALEEL